MKINNVSPSRLLRLPEVCAAISHSAEWIRLAELRGEFIPRVRVGKRSIAYNSRDLENWIQSRQQVTH